MNKIAKTHPGKVRDHNEDAYLCEPDLNMAVIADGMGGHAAGEVAAEITINTCRELAPSNADLTATMMECHHRIAAHAKAHPESRGMGCAVVAARFCTSTVEICWAGDSRAYLYNKDKGLSAISRDHSYVQWLLINGQINERQARIHPDRNLVMQCLGVKPPQPETNTVSWKSNDMVLLCSDGLTDEVEDKDISAILAQADTLESAVDDLLLKALDNGGKDNITVALIQNAAKPVQNIADKMILTKIKAKPWLAIALAGSAVSIVGLLWYLL